MDWSKASNILIVLFLAVDLALGLLYFDQQQSIKARELAAAANTAI